MQNKSASTISTILQNAKAKSKEIQTPFLNDEQVDQNHMLRIYQWGKKQLWKILTGFIVIIVALTTYMLYSTEFKNKTITDLVQLNKKINEMQKEMQNINSVCKVNSNEISNVKYRLETVKKFKHLEIEINNLKNIPK